MVLGEIFFMLLIILLGLFLFAFLIGNMQNFLQSLNRRYALLVDAQSQEIASHGWPVVMKLRGLMTYYQRSYGKDCLPEALLSSSRREGRGYVAHHVPGTF